MVSSPTDAGIACRQSEVAQEEAGYQKTLPPRNPDNGPYIPFQVRKRLLWPRSHSPEKTQLPSFSFYS